MKLMLDALVKYVMGLALVGTLLFLPAERMEQLRKLQAAGVTVLWMYAPDYARGSENSARQISEAVVLARFEDGAAAIAATRDGRSVYAAVPYLPSAPLREILRERGVFLYSCDPRVYTYADASAIGVYNATAGSATVLVREDGEYLDLITNEEFSAVHGKIVLSPRELRAYLLVRRS